MYVTLVYGPEAIKTTNLFIAFRDRYSDNITVDLLTVAYEGWVNGV